MTKSDNWTDIKEEFNYPFLRVRFHSLYPTLKSLERERERETEVAYHTGMLKIS